MFVRVAKCLPLPVERLTVSPCPKGHADEPRGIAAPLDLPANASRQRRSAWPAHTGASISHAPTIHIITHELQVEVSMRSFCCAHINMHLRAPSLRTPAAHDAVPILLCDAYRRCFRTLDGTKHADGPGSPPSRLTRRAAIVQDTSDEEDNVDPEEVAECACPPRELHCALHTLASPHHLPTPFCIDVAKVTCVCVCVCVRVCVRACVRACVRHIQRVRLTWTSRPRFRQRREAHQSRGRR